MWLAMDMPNTNLSPDDDRGTGAVGAPQRVASTLFSPYKCYLYRTSKQSRVTWS